MNTKVYFTVTIANSLSDYQGKNIFSASNEGLAGTPAEAYIALQHAAGNLLSASDPYLVQQMYEATWAGQATDISAEAIPGGMGINFTATSSGAAYADMYVSSDEINRLVDQFVTYLGILLKIRN